MSKINYSKQIARNTAQSAKHAKAIESYFAAANKAFGVAKARFYKWMILAFIGLIAADKGAPPLVQWIVHLFSIGG